MGQFVLFMMPEAQQKEKKREKKNLLNTLRECGHEALSLKKDLDSLLKMGANYFTDMQQEREQLR